MARKLPKNIQRCTREEVLFLCKNAGLWRTVFLKPHRSFPRIFQKFFRVAVLWNNCWWLLRLLTDFGVSSFFLWFSSYFVTKKIFLRYYNCGHKITDYRNNLFFNIFSFLLLLNCLRLCFSLRKGQGFADRNINSVK